VELLVMAVLRDFLFRCIHHKGTDVAEFEVISGKKYLLCALRAAAVIHRED